MNNPTQSAVAGILLISAALIGFSWIRWQIRWHGVRADLLEWADQLDRTDNSVEEFVRSNVNLDDDALRGQRFSVSTAESVRMKLPNGSIGWHTGSDAKEDPHRFFVTPPGVWVGTVDEVIETWNQHYHAASG